MVKLTVMFSSRVFPAVYTDTTAVPAVIFRVCPEKRGVWRLNWATLYRAVQLWPVAALALVSKRFHKPWLMEPPRFKGTVTVSFLAYTLRRS